MAMHRKPVDESGPPPPELLNFRPDQWTAATTPQETTWYPAYNRWCDARHAWAQQHPGWLGDAIERMQHEHATRKRIMAASPLEEVGAVSIRNHVIRGGVYDPLTGRIRGRLPGEEHIPAGGTGNRYCDWS
jgi:hypothetical protein